MRKDERCITLRLIPHGDAARITSQLAAQWLSRPGNPPEKPLRRSSWFAATAFALAAAPLAAAPTAFDPARLSHHVQILGSDAFEGRAPATRAETKTVDYIVGQFREAGLQPGGDLVNGKRQWTQAVPLLKSDIAGTPQVILDLGNGQRLNLAQGEQIAVRSPTNGQGAVNLADAPLVFVGYGVDAPERDWDDFKGVGRAGARCSSCSSTTPTSRAAKAISAARR